MAVTLNNPHLAQDGQVLFSLFTAFAFIAYALRIYDRVVIRKNPGWDDLAISVAMAISIATLVVALLAIENGVGKHINEVPLSELPTGLFYLDLLSALVAPFVMVPKLAVVLLLIRLFKMKRITQVLLLGQVTIGIIFTIVVIFMLFLRCDPVKAAWDIFIPAKCANRDALLDITFLTSAWAIFVDVTFATYPIFVIWGLQMPKKKKINTIILMAIGLVATAVSIVKAAMIEQVRNTTDPLFSGLPSSFFAIIEGNLCIVAACVPTLSGFAQNVGQKTNLLYSRLRGSTLRSTTMGSSRGTGRLEKSSNISQDSDVVSSKQRMVKPTPEWNQAALLSKTDSLESDPEAGQTRTAGPSFAVMREMHWETSTSQVRRPEPAQGGTNQVPRSYYLQGI